MKQLRLLFSVLAALAILLSAAVPARCDGCEEHIYDGGTMILAPTCEGSGVIVYTCTACGATVQASIGCLGHRYENGVCTRCGKPEKDFLEEPVPSGSAEPTLWDVAMENSTEPAEQEKAVESVTMEHVTVTSGNKTVTAGGGSGHKTPSYVVLIGVLMMMAVVVTAGTDKPRKKKAAVKKASRKRPAEMSDSDFYN